MPTTVIRVIRVALLICLLDHSHSALSAPKPDKEDAGNAFFTNHTIPRIRIKLNEQALTALRNKFREYTKATVMEGTNIWREIGIHLKGQD